MLHFLTKSLLALLAASPNLATAEEIECEVYAVEDISASGWHRERVFVATNNYTPQAATALGYILARQAASSRKLDFVDVYVTRKIDGVSRADHSKGTTLAQVKYNPGRSPVMRQLLTAKVVTRPVQEVGELGIIHAERRQLSQSEITSLLQEASAEETHFSCAH